MPGAPTQLCGRMTLVAITPHVSPPRAGGRRTRTDTPAQGRTGRGRARRGAGSDADGAVGAGARDGEDTRGDGDRNPTPHAGDGDIHTTDSAAGDIRPGAVADGPGEARHGLRLDGAAMTTQTMRGIAPLRDGQGVLPCTTFTWRECVGYNAHHEGVRHVAQCAAEAAAKARGPPAGTGEPRACLD